MSTTLTWPSTLPVPAIAGYGIKPRPNVDRTELEWGQARQRRRSTGTTDEISLQFVATRWQVMLFESWFKNRALEGAAWFNITLLGGTGLVSYEARFKGGSEISYVPINGENWTITATVEVRDRNMLTDDELTVMLAEDPSTFFTLLAGVHTAVQAMPTA